MYLWYYQVQLKITAKRIAKNTRRCDSSKQNSYLFEIINSKSWIISYLSDTGENGKTNMFTSSFFRVDATNHVCSISYGLFTVKCTLKKDDGFMFFIEILKRILLFFHPSLYSFICRECSMQLELVILRALSIVNF